MMQCNPWLIIFILITVFLFPFLLYSCSRFCCTPIPIFTVFLLPGNKDISSNEDWTTLWETEYKPGLCHDLLGEFNTNMFDYGYRVRFGSFENAHYQILLRVNSITEKSNTIMNAYIVERGQKNVLCNLFISGTGGTFGSKVNLMGDGFKRAGKELARQMNILFKRGRI